VSPLCGLIEVGEGHVAAEHDVKVVLWQGDPDVLRLEAYERSILQLHPEPRHPPGFVATRLQFSSWDRDANAPYHRARRGSAGRRGGAADASCGVEVLIAFGIPPRSWWTRSGGLLEDHVTGLALGYQARQRAATRRMP
jgi:hypothetical protein